MKQMHEKNNEDYSLLEEFAKNSENPLIVSPMADAYAGILMYKMIKPVAKLFIKSGLIIFLTGYLGGAGLKYIMDNTGFGHKITCLEQKIADSEEYKAFSIAVNSVAMAR